MFQLIVDSTNVRALLSKTIFKFCWAQSRREMSESLLSLFNKLRELYMKRKERKPDGVRVEAEKSRESNFPTIKDENVTPVCNVEL